MVERGVRTLVRFGPGVFVWVLVRCGSGVWVFFVWGWGWSWGSSCGKVRVLCWYLGMGLALGFGKELG